MAKIHSLIINNFRSFKRFEHTFSNSNFFCIIGRGDSGKSTILDSIAYALSSSWNLTFYDSDFYNCETNSPIEIEITLINLPEKLIHEDKYGMYIRGIDILTNKIIDDLENDHIKALTIRLEIKKDLEPKWYIINGRCCRAPKVCHERAPFLGSKCATSKHNLNIHFLFHIIERGNDGKCAEDGQETSDYRAHKDGSVRQGYS